MRVLDVCGRPAFIQAASRCIGGGKCRPAGRLCRCHVCHSSGSGGQCRQAHVVLCRNSATLSLLRVSEGMGLSVTDAQCWLVAVALRCQLYVADAALRHDCAPNCDLGCWFLGGCRVVLGQRTVWPAAVLAVVFGMACCQGLMLCLSVHAPSGHQSRSVICTCCCQVARGNDGAVVLQASGRPLCPLVVACLLDNI